MYTLIIAIHVISCIILIFIILIQSGKGGGLSEAFGGGGSNTMKSLFGTQSTNVLTKVTIGLVILFLLTSLTLTVLGKMKSTSLIERMKEEEAEQTTETDEEEPLELPLNPGSMPVR